MVDVPRTATGKELKVEDQPLGEGVGGDSNWERIERRCQSAVAAALERALTATGKELKVSRWTP